MSRLNKRENDIMDARIRWVLWTFGDAPMKFQKIVNGYPGHTHADLVMAAIDARTVGGVQRVIERRLQALRELDAIEYLAFDQGGPGWVLLEEDAR